MNERVDNKANSWTVQFLTKGGKEVMINPVASAMPNHVMSCYRLPKAVIKKITGAIAHFWWSSGGNKRDIQCSPRIKYVNPKREVLALEIFKILIRLCWQ